MRRARAWERSVVETEPANSGEPGEISRHPCSDTDVGSGQRHATDHAIVASRTIREPSCEIELYRALAGEHLERGIFPGSGPKPDALHVGQGCLARMGRQVESDADFDSRRDQAPRVEGDALHGRAVPGRCDTRRPARETQAVRCAGATCGTTPEDKRGTAARSRWESSPTAGSSSDRAPQHPDTCRPRIANRRANGSPNARRARVRRRFGRALTVGHGDTRGRGLGLLRADRRSEPEDGQ